MRDIVSTLLFGVFATSISVMIGAELIRWSRRQDHDRRLQSLEVATAVGYVFTYLSAVALISFHSICAMLVDYLARDERVQSTATMIVWGMICIGFAYAIREVVANWERFEKYKRESESILTTLTVLECILVGCAFVLRAIILYVEVTGT